MEVTAVAELKPRNSVVIPGFAATVLRWLHPRDQLPFPYIKGMFEEASPLAQQARRLAREECQGDLAAGLPLLKLYHKLAPNSACGWLSRLHSEDADAAPADAEPEDEAKPSPAQLVWALAAQMQSEYELTRRPTSVCVCIPGDAPEIDEFYLFCDSAWLSRKRPGPFELIILKYQQWSAPCDKSQSLRDCIQYVYDLDRHGVIHGYAVPAGGGDSTLLAQVGGCFAPKKDAYVFLVKTDGCLFLIILQVAFTIIECTGVVRIEKSAPAAFTATACSLWALVGDSKLRINVCAYALVLLMMRGTGYRGPLKCRASTRPAYTTPARTWGAGAGRRDKMCTLVYQEPELESPRGEAAAAPVPVPNNINAFGDVTEYDVEGPYPSIRDMANPAYVTAACGNPAHAAALACADPARGVMLVRTNPAFASSLARADPASGGTLVRNNPALAPFLAPAATVVGDCERSARADAYAPLPYGVSGGPRDDY